MPRIDIQHGDDDGFVKMVVWYGEKQACMTVKMVMMAMVMTLVALL